MGVRVFSTAIARRTSSGRSGFGTMREEVRGADSSRSVNLPRSRRVCTGVGAGAGFAAAFSAFSAMPLLRYSSLVMVL